MKHVTAFRLLAASLMLATTARVLGHHSVNAFFDQARIVEISGTIADISWQNPHVGFTVDVVTEGGTQQWRLISSSINSLERNGLSKAMFQNGDRVRAAGWPVRRGQNGLFITNFLMASGEEALMTATNPQPRRWTQAPTSRETDEPNTRSATASGVAVDLFRVWVRGAAYSPRKPLAFTATAAAARAQWDPVTDDPALRCIPPGMSNAILNPYPIEFVDRGDTILLRMEEWQATRTIHLRNLPDTLSVAPSPLGFSVGHWAENTLIVQTSRINWPWLDGDGTPQSEAVTMTERFTLVPDSNRLDFELTVVDPENLVEPATWDAYWVWDPDVAIKPYECVVE